MSPPNTVVATHYTRNMPLLTELGWCSGGVCYNHGAPNGAFPKPNSCRVTLAHTPQNAILPIQQIDNLRYVTVFVPQYT